jgi:hypothetical protein
VPPTGERPEERLRLRRVPGFAEDPAAQRDGRVGTEDDILLARLHRRDLLGGDACAIGAREFPLPGVLVDIGGADGVGHDAQNGQKLQPPWAAGAENKPCLQELI